MSFYTSWFQIKSSHTNKMQSCKRTSFVIRLKKLEKKSINQEQGRKVIEEYNEDKLEEDQVFKLTEKFHHAAM
ncbi:hypothetical protein K1719_043085 [Acacia pycnantha]|nr:hypothetical protein K1719_043085 [Acacia pycnantha]